MDGEITGALTLSVAQAAEYAGVSSKTVYRAIEDGRLRATALGRSAALRVRPEWIHDWIESNIYTPPSRPARVSPATYSQAVKRQPRRRHLVP